MIEISPPKGLHRIIYASRFSKAFPGIVVKQDEEVQSIICRSIENNRRDGISGLLLVHKDHFLQVLEGPSGAVTGTYHRILADARHCSSRLISAGPGRARLFGEWNMCARRLTAADDAILQTLDLKGNLDPSKLSADAALNLLSVIAGIQKRTAAVKIA